LTVTINLTFTLGAPTRKIILTVLNAITILANVDQKINAQNATMIHADAIKRNIRQTAKFAPLVLLVQEA
jgi:hypothetical protein